MSEFALAPLVTSLMHSVATAEPPAYGPEGAGLRLPLARRPLPFRPPGDSLDMAYLDVKPATPKGHFAVLLRGKNLCVAAWQTTITTLAQADYRVIAPDQIGFCKSTKPAH